MFLLSTAVGPRFPTGTPVRLQCGPGKAAVRRRYGDTPEWFPCGPAHMGTTPGYRLDRDPKEPLFGFGRCLAHSAVDPNLVYVTTHLRGAKTRFLTAIPSTFRCP